MRAGRLGQEAKPGGGAVAQIPFAFEAVPSESPIIITPIRTGTAQLTLSYHGWVYTPAALTPSTSALDLVSPSAYRL